MSDMRNYEKFLRGGLSLGLLSAASLLMPLSVSAALSLGSVLEPRGSSVLPPLPTYSLQLDKELNEGDILTTGLAEPAQPQGVLSPAATAPNFLALSASQVDAVHYDALEPAEALGAAQSDSLLLAELQPAQPQVATVTGGALADTETAEPSLVNITSQLELTFADATAASILLLEDEFTFSINQGKFAFAGSRAARLVFDLVENVVIPPGDIVSGSVAFVVHHPLTYTAAEQAVVSVTAEGQLGLVAPRGGLPHLSQPASYTANGFLGADEVPIEVIVLADTNYVLN